MSEALYIGLLSGTSMDGIDAALFEIGDRHCAARATARGAYPAELRDALLAASRNPETCGIDALGELDHWVGECFGETAGRLLAESAVGPRGVRAIGSHGQTIRHRPDARRRFTMQIGDPNRIAAATGITTVADFRRRDVALGGEGAPLATAFHQWLLADENENRVVLNIGGIANVTILRAGGGGVFGFDTGPGNTLLDAWIGQAKGEAFDRDGAWADSGTVDEALLDALLGDPWFAAPPPKSTGFERFNLGWLGDVLAGLQSGAPAAHDVQATLTALTAHSIAAAIERYAPAAERVLVCGGGARNGSLMQRLRASLAAVPVDSTAAFGIDPDWVEAATFAWLAKRCLDRQPGNLPAVTGASRETILGAIYPGA